MTMSAKTIAKKILTKDTCYGMYDHTSPTDEELSDYFAIWIEDYAIQFHKSQSIKDKDIMIEREKNKVNWWNTETL
jgi:hypothetical protein